MTSPSPVILITSYFPRPIAVEGVGAFLRGVGEEFLHRGWKVRMVLPAGSRNFPEGVEVSAYSPGLVRGMRAYRSAVRACSAEADLVLLVENNPNLVALADASLRPENTFCHFYTPLQSARLLREAGWSRQALLHVLAKNRWLARRRSWSSRRCLVGSAFQAEQLRDLGDCEVHVIPACGVSRTQAVPSRREARERLGWDETPVAGYLGHFAPLKGVDVLIKACSSRRADFVLAPAHSGMGRLSRRSRTILGDLKAAGRCREAGLVDPLTFLAACDLVVLPYLACSGLFMPPQVMLESFAAATAVVASNVDGFAEVLKSGQTGDLVPPRDAGALADAIDRMIANLPETHRLGQVAREQFETRYCREIFADKLLSLRRAPIGGKAGIGPSMESRLTAAKAEPTLPDIRKRDAWAARSGLDTYEGKMGYYALRRDAEIVRSLLGRGPGTLLDLPCGTGRFLDMERELGFDVVAADYSPAMLDLAERHEGVRVMRADAFDPPFPAASFDVILATRLLFHYDRPERIVAALLPCLKPSGRMIFDTLNPFSTRWLASRTLGLVRRDPARRLYFVRQAVLEKRLRDLRLTVLERRSAYVLPTRAYRFLPGPVSSAVGWIEGIVPPPMRVLTYWHVRRGKTE